MPRYPRSIALVVFALAFTFALPLALIQAMEVGTPAPGFGPIIWIQGKEPPLSGLPVLVTFWATTSPACRELSPVLSELAKKSGDKAAVVGLTIEEDGAVRSYLAEHGPELTYAVGVADPALIETWRSGDEAVPFAVVLAKDRTILWQGNTYAAPRVLTQVLAGTWDVELATTNDQVRHQLSELVQRPPGPGADPTAVLTRILTTTATVLESDPSDVDTISLRLGVARHLANAEIIQQTLAAIPVADLWPSQAEALAREALNEEDPGFVHLDQALRLALRASEGSEPRPSALALLARVEYRIGLVDLAEKTQRKALELDPEDTELATVAEFYTATAALSKQIKAGGLTAVSIAAVSLAANCLTTAGTATAAQGEEPAWNDRQISAKTTTTTKTNVKPTAKANRNLPAAKARPPATERQDEAIAQPPATGPSERRR